MEGGLEPGRKERGVVREAAVERKSKMLRSGRKRENNATLCNILQSKKHKEAGAK